MEARDISPPQVAKHPRRARHYDVIVVGARVAGAATAMLLARSGAQVLVLDRAPSAGTDTLSTHALMRAGVLQLHRWGLLTEVRASRAPGVPVTVVHYGDAAQHVRLKEKAGIDRLFAPRRTVLDPILAQAAVSAGAELRYGASVSALLSSRGRVQGVVGQSRSGRRFEARASLVVGADGLGSRVARQAAAPVTWQGTGAGAMIYGYWHDLPLEGYEWFYRPNATAGFIPTNDSLACVWVGAPAASFPELRRDLEGAYRELLGRAAPEARDLIAGARRVGRLRGFPGAPGYLRRPWGEGWALVGDAGSFRDPLSAHGMTDALRDAELLARAIVQGLGGENLEAALRGYERRRDEVALPLARCIDAIASYRWSLARVRELLMTFSRVMGSEVDLLAGLDPAGEAAA